MKVAPLSLPGVTDAAWRLTVRTATNTVWTRDLRARPYGDGAGSLSYVGPCDADAGLNTVEVELLDLYQGAAGDVLLEPATYDNPGPVSRDVVCSPDADVSVAFDLTLSRAAQQGFFDIGVTFDDLFCSAKLDCQKPDGSPITLLADASGARRPTVVLGFACTADTAADDTVLYLDPVLLTCNAGANTAAVDPSAGPGNLTDGDGLTQTAGTAALFGAAAYRGEEDLGGVGKIYWNLALGPNLGTVPAQSCTLTTQGTASAGPLDGFATPLGATYPFIRWNVPVTDASGALTCTTHPVTGGNGVAIAYADPDAPEPFAFTFNGATSLPQSWGLIGAGTAADPHRWADDSLAPSCDAYRNPAAPYAYSGATGDGLYRVDPDGAGPTPALVVACDMTTAGGGWTLILRDAWNNTTVPKGLTALPTENSAGTPDGALDYVGPWETFAGDYLYRRADVGGDNAFIVHQNFGLGLTKAMIHDSPTYTYDTPIVTLAGGQTVMADSLDTKRLNYLYAFETPDCGALATGRDNGSNCWNNFFGNYYWDNLPGGSAFVASVAGHVAELWVRDNGATPPTGVALVGARTTADPGRWADGTLAASCRDYRFPPDGYAYLGATGDGLYRIDPDGAGPVPAVVVACDMATAGGGWTLILRDVWSDVLVPKGTLTLPSQGTVGSPASALDYVGPWESLAGDYLYRRADATGDVAFVSHQSFGLGLTHTLIAALPGATYDQPLSTLALGAVVRDSNSVALNYFWSRGLAACGAVHSGVANGTNCWNNFFGTSYWENLPGGSTYTTNSATHIATLWVRARTSAASPTDPAAAAVVLDLRADGPDGSTSFVDDSPSAHTVIAAGDVHYTTSTSPDAGSSIAFDGDGDYLTVAPSPDFDFGTDDFTVEYWLRLAGTPRRQYAVSFGDSATSGNLLFDYEDTDDGGHSLWFYWNSTGIPRVVDGAVGKYTDSLWHHYALVRSGTTVTAYVDGQPVGATTETDAMGSATQPLTVGRLPSYPLWDLGGHLDRLRVTKGVARYTGPFTL